MTADEARLCHEVERVLQEAGLLEDQRPLLVAVSGGPDSLALLHLLHTLSDRHPLSLHVAHLNHGLRGPESEEDGRYVCEVAGNLSLPVTSEAADVGAFRRERRLSWEAAAREVRYAFLSQTAERIGAAAVALGHTADDQAETVLLHLLRGSGLQGLRGMLPHTVRRSRNGTRRLALLRPLLRVTREETVAYCQARGLAPRHDSSNLEERYTRNRIRHRLLPSLAQYNPSIREALVRLARTAARDMDFIDRQLQQAWLALVTPEPWGLRVRRDGFRGLHPSLQAHLLRRAWEELAGETADLTSTQVEAMMDLVRGEEGGRRSLSLGRGVRFHTGYEEITLGRRPASAPLPPMEPALLSLPGEAHIHGWRVTARLVDGPVQVGAGEPYRAHLDVAALGDRVQIRPRRAGDRFQPLGMEGTKRLNEFMIDARIPKNWRDRVPLLEGESGVAWVVGWRIAHWARVTEATGQVVEVIFAREE
ncbi:MAG: tRNA lysidine(34) synthetase TilS [Chloroflexi bacterium]|nr:tRNA lysidine(34) synthetase TilS [Chloroflexota bacterium]